MFTALDLLDLNSETLNPEALSFAMPLSGSLLDKFRLRCEYVHPKQEYKAIVFSIFPMYGRACLLPLLHSRIP